MIFLAKLVIYFCFNTPHTQLTPHTTPSPRHTLIAGHLRFTGTGEVENQFARISGLRKFVWVVSSHTKIDTDTNEYLDYKN